VIPKWNETASSPVADVCAEAQRMRAAAGPQNGTLRAGQPGTHMLFDQRCSISRAAMVPPPYTPGCRCGCSDGRRVR
jgi:hypothetical protein